MPLKRELIGAALREHASQFRTFVGARVPPAEVDDVLQTAAMRAVERSESLRDADRVVPWLYKLHRNVIADMMRTRGSRERLLDRSASAPEMSVPEPDNLCKCSLVQARRMNPAYASMLSLVDAGDASLAEAAATLGISVNNAAVRLHRARHALRKAMLEHCGVQNSRDCVACRCVVQGCCAA